MSEPRATLSLVLAGSGGAGVMTAGELLLEAACRAGYYGIMSKLAGPQVRGGEAASLLRLSAQPVEGPGDGYDLLCAVDWRNVTRFAPEIPLQHDAVILADPAAGAVPAKLAQSGARQVEVPLTAFAHKIPGGRNAMVAAGLLGALAGLALADLLAVVPKLLDVKGAQAVASSCKAIEAGHAAAAGLALDRRLAPPRPAQGRWLISGNEALALGALRGGVRFVAGYPITPATDFVEWMAPALPRLGGTLVQAEDELAAINLALGASFGGVPSMTVTSGPGLSLMVESIGLAVASETPVVIVDVMRSGPSTGIPTKSEQADLNLALYGSHGDAPRIVLAPSSIADAIPTMEWAVALAEGLQTPVLVLGDQQMGQARAVIDPPGPPAPRVARLTPDPATPKPYHRYALTPSGLSPMAVPGMAGLAWVGDGLTHDEAGAPATGAQDHNAQIAKRWTKLVSHDYGARWCDVEGEASPDVALLAFGSAVAPAREAAARLRASGHKVRLVALRLLAPLREAALVELLAPARRVVVIEQNMSGQLFQYLRGKAALPPAAESFARGGPLPFTAKEILAHLLQERAA